MVRTDTETRGRAAAAEARRFVAVDVGLLKIAGRLGLDTEEERPSISAIVAGLERRNEEESRFRERTRRALRRAYVRMTQAMLEVTLFKAACPNVSVDATAERLRSQTQEVGRDQASRVFEALLAGDSDEGPDGAET